MAATTTSIVVTSSLVIMTSTSSTTTATTAVNYTPMSTSVVANRPCTRSSTGNSKVVSTFMKVKVSPDKSDSPSKDSTMKVKVSPGKSVSPSKASSEEKRANSTQQSMQVLDDSQIVELQSMDGLASNATATSFTGDNLDGTNLTSTSENYPDTVALTRSPYTVGALHSTNTESPGLYPDLNFRAQQENRRSMGDHDSDSSGTFTPSESPNPSLPPKAVPIHDNYTLHKMIVERDAKIDAMEEKVGKLEQKFEFLHSLLHVKDSVLRGVQDELHRLQQYTRRYSVSISGIPKRRGEKPEDLRRSVEDIINAVNSTTTPLDIDKLHRNGPVYGDRGSKQDTIVRFKSHSAKEAFYRARKSLPAEKQDIYIRPSLSEAQKVLLSDAKEYIKNNNSEAYGSNPPEFVFANIHGNVQVKMKKATKYGLFIDIKSVSHLAQIIARANDSDQTLLYHHEKEGSWDDVESNSDDDMGFALFD